MRTAHVCPSCGCDLSRVRAPADPVYGLPVVVCPGCGAASVRRLVLARWHGAGLWLLARSLGRGLGAVLALLVITGASIGVVLFNASALQLSALASATPASKTRLDMWVDEYGPTSLLLLALGPVPAALGLRWALPHLRSGGRTLLWLGSVVALVWVVPNAMAQMDYWLTLPISYTDFASRTRSARPPRLEMGHWLWVVCLGLFLSIMLVSEPLCVRFGRSIGRRRLRGRLARARRRRMKGRA